EVSHVVVVSRDVTERRRTEEQMREQAAMLEKAHDAICVTDTELRITYWNRGAAVLYGWEPQEAVGAFVHELLFEADSTEPATALKTLIARSEWQGEYTQTRRDGRRMIVESRWTLLRDEEGRPKSILLINRDVTERKLAQVKVQEQAALLEKAQDAIFVRDLEQRITYWNRGAERIYGWKAAEVMGRRADQLLYKEASPAREEIWREFLERGEWAGELEQITKAGKSVIIQSRRTLLLDPEGHPRAILNINTDVTEQRQLESKFLRTQRLESIGALAGGIAHDLNNVLAPVLMGVEFLRDTVTGEGNLRVIETISSSARRGADMVRQILSFARGVEGRRGVLQMRHLLREMTALIQDTFPRSIQIETANAANLHPVTGDATQIQQVLLNLCVNARDAMPGGGMLRLETGNAQIENRTTPMLLEPVSGPFVRLLVSDTGAGIPSHVMDRIFEPFFTTKEPGRGTGLGLSTVLDIVRSHGGFVEVISQEGRGTTFEVFLPAAPEPEQKAAEQAAPELPAGRAELVLVIDDETAVLEMTRTVLETFGYHVLTASDGPQALGLYRTHQDEVAVVLTDIMMPVMDGPATLRALREMRPGLKAIGLSGMDAEVQSAIQAGTSFSAFLTKPYSTRNLLETLRRTLDEAPGSPGSVQK
ncbi:MAG TPA: PAS domain S-box protein, partial [Methylomirabilota bacterium]|nr:PAS domain S-box protein [Methylomirabilota bacterium]